MDWHTVTQLSDHQHETREGYLAVRDVVIARTGTQIYYEHEIPPLVGDAGGRVHVRRDPEDVFDEDSIRSFAGKPLCDDHPSEMVGPDNWSDLAIGYVTNVRRGEHANDDVLLADMIFTTRKGIEAVRSGKRAISVGYTANYDQDAPGLGRQKDIFCNHVALVDEGRCGSRCVILDGVPFYNEDHAIEEAGPAGWHDDVDYPCDEDIDFADAGFVEGPRLPRWFPKWLQVFVGDDAAFIESEHPRDEFGKFAEKGHAAAAVKEPPSWIGKSGKSAKSAVVEGLTQGHEPEVIAAKIKAAASTHTHPNSATYANNLLNYVAIQHGLPQGSLGKAYPKGKGGEVPAAALQAPAPTLTAQAAAAHGTAPEKLVQIANDPTKLEELSKTSHILGQSLTGVPTEVSKASKGVINTWTSPSGYKLINNHVNGTATSANGAALSDELQKAVLSQKLTASAHAWRGVHGPQLDQISAMKQGDVWTQKGFTATTLDPKRATHYAKGGEGGALIHMVMPKGSRGLYVSHPELNPGHQSEREMLLPAGSTFKYLGSETMTLPKYDYNGVKTGEGGPTVVHHVQVMQPGDPEFDAAHPRGEGGKFAAKPGSDPEEIEGKVGAEPEDSGVGSTHDPSVMPEPEPGNDTQEWLQQDIEKHTGTTAEKLAYAQNEAAFEENPEDKAYANAVVAHLQHKLAKESAASPEPAATPGPATPGPATPAPAAEAAWPTATTPTQGNFLKFAQNQGGASAQEKADFLKGQIADYPGEEAFFHGLISKLEGSEPAALPEPQGSTQEYLHALVGETPGTNEQKIAALEKEKQHFQSPDAQKYIQNMQAALGGKAVAPDPVGSGPGPAPANVLPLPDNINNQLQAGLYVSMTKAKTHAEQVAAINAVMNGNPSPSSKGYAKKLSEAVQEHYEKTADPDNDPAPDMEEEDEPEGIPKPLNYNNGTQINLHAAVSAAPTKAEKLAHIHAILAGGFTSGTANYAAKLQAHVEAMPDDPAPTPEAPKGPDPNPGSKGQIEIHQQATSTAMTPAQKIAGIHIVMNHPNAGAFTKAFGHEWVKALGGDPTAAPATPATPTPTPVAAPATPTPAPKPTSLKNPHNLSKFPHHFHEAKHRLENAQGQKLTAKLSVDTEKIPENLYHEVSAAYGTNPHDGNTDAVGAAMQKAANHAEQQMSGPEQSAAQSYKGAGYKGINAKLLAGGTSPTIQKLRAIMKKTVIPANTPAFRGMRATLKDLSGFDDPELAVGRAFVHKNFASMSRNITTAESFGSLHNEGSPTSMMHVTILAGTPGLVLGGQHYGEKELVLPDHSVFRIDKVVATGAKGIKHHIHVTYMGVEDA